MIAEGTLVGDMLCRVEKTNAVWAPHDAVTAPDAPFPVNEHNTIKSTLETELRNSVKSVLELTTHRLIEDRWHGVLSLVQHIHSQVEEQLWNPLPLPVAIPPSSYPVEDYPEFDSLF